MTTIVMPSFHFYKHALPVPTFFFYANFGDICTPSEIKKVELERMISSLKLARLLKWRAIITTMVTEGANERDHIENENGSLPVDSWRTPELQSEAISPIDCGGTAEYVHKMLLAGATTESLERSSKTVELSRAHIEKTMQHLANMMTRTARKQYETTFGLEC